MLTSGVFTLHALQGDIARIREVYDSFLAQYPLCFGYWKKYADAEGRHASADAAAAVYERGVAAIPYSVDFWGHYAAFKAASGAGQEAVCRCPLPA
jgi:pre-mRNA-processing factor 39